jgi:hypothetical protein
VPNSDNRHGVNLNKFPPPALRVLVKALRVEKVPDSLMKKIPRQ